MEIFIQCVSVEHFFLVQILRAGRILALKTTSSQVFGPFCHINTIFKNLKVGGSGQQTRCGAVLKAKSGLRTEIKHKRPTQRTLSTKFHTKSKGNNE